MKEKKGNVLLTHFIYSYTMADIIIMVKDHSDNERGVIFYAPFHKQDSVHHILWCTSCEALAGMRNSSMGPPRGNNLPLSYIPANVVIITYVGVR